MAGRSAGRPRAGRRAPARGVDRWLDGDQLRCRRPGRAASLALLDPVMTFAPIPLTALVVSVAMFVPRVPEWLRRRVFSWIAGGAEVDDSLPEAALISAAVHRLRAAQGDAEDDHRRTAAIAGSSGAGADRRPQRDARPRRVRWPGLEGCCRAGRSSCGRTRRTPSTASTRRRLPSVRDRSGMTWMRIEAEPIAAS